MGITGGGQSVRIMEKPRDGRKLSRVKDLGAATSKGEAREGRERVKDEKVGSRDLT